MSPRITIDICGASSAHVGFGRQWRTGYPPGFLLEVIGDQPDLEAAAHAFCASHGHTLLAVEGGLGPRRLVRIRWNGPRASRTG